MSTLPIPKSPPDLTDVGIADAVARTLLAHGVGWIVERSRWATRSAWLTREQVESFARQTLETLHRDTLEAASTWYGIRNRASIAKSAGRLRSASVLPMAVRLAKSDVRLHRPLAWTDASRPR